MNIIDAAQSLILSLNSPAIGHAVWVNTDVVRLDPDDPKTGEFVQTIHVAVRPTYLNKIKVPKEHQGHTVVQVPWPKGA